MSRYDEVRSHIRNAPRKWLVTGVAGFIGSNLLEALLRLGQTVVGIDNFSTGSMRNLADVQESIDEQQWQRFRLIEGDICSLKDCMQACAGVDYVLHQAALGSVPRSLADPITTNNVNISGFLNMLVAVRDSGVKTFTYAASSSTYGDNELLPKLEDRIGKPLSPYAVTKQVNELYADVFGKCFGIHSVGLRYFNVFGPRQSPDGAYAAVIPKWIASMMVGDEVTINGDGESSRDFTFVEDAVQANLLAATLTDGSAKSQVYNVAVGRRTTLNQLFEVLRNSLSNNGIYYNRMPIYANFRAGDVRHSQASIEKAEKWLGYSPAFTIETGIEITVPKFIRYNQ